MNWDQIEGKWKQYSGRFREKWGKLTDDDWHVIVGKRDQLVGRIQERYGMAKEQAQREVDDFVRTMQPEALGTQEETPGVPGKARRAGQP
ncbi:MAG: CsbD family protein [Acidobacteria bacterium]|nr:MAG: CsbD family protein [Acidobacteriota bacterium]